MTIWSDCHLLVFIDLVRTWERTHFVYDLDHIFYKLMDKGTFKDYARDPEMQENIRNSFVSETRRFVFNTTGLTSLACKDALW